MSSLGLIAQGRPGFIRDDFGEVYCKFAAGCAAAQLLPPEVDRAVIDTSAPQNADGPVVVNDHLIGHNLDLVAALQAVHDARAYRLSVGDRADRITLQDWQTHWLERVLKVAQDKELDATRVLEAARAKGWKIPEVLS